jgi:hypothetical protein
MRSSRRPQLFGVVAVVVGLAVSTLVVAPAHAAQWHDIEGTVWSDGETWFSSSTIREKDGNGAIDAVFNSLMGGGIDFGVRNTSHTWLGQSPLAFPTEGDPKTLATSVSNGTEFYTRYKRGTSCQSWWCNHNFAGSIKY